MMVEITEDWNGMKHIVRRPAPNATSELKGMVRLWVVRGTYEGTPIHLLHHIGRTPEDVARSVMNRAREEGFRGTLDQRLDELHWKIVSGVFTEDEA